MPTRREAAQQRNAVRQQARQELANLLGVSRREVEYPHSNRELEETRNRIQVIRNRINREVQELNEARVREERTNAEFLELAQTDPFNILPTLEFERREQVRVGREIVDSNFIAFVLSIYPNRYDYHDFLLQNRSCFYYRFEIPAAIGFREFHKLAHRENFHVFHGKCLHEAVQVWVRLELLLLLF